MASKIQFSQETLCVKEYEDKINTRPHQLPIYATSSFVFGDMHESVEFFSGNKNAYAYGRYGNPTIDTVAAKIADLEAYGTGVNAWGLMTSSGMSAISTVVQALLKNGDKILTQGNLYGGTTELFVKILSRAGVEVVFTDLTQEDRVEDILKNDRRIRLLYFETPANPTLACVDIRNLAALARKYGVTSCIDNTFCTPVIQQPLIFGVDIIIHSTTKYLNGHGNSIAGAIVGIDKDARQKIWTTLKLAGGTCNPFDAWLVNNGLKTLSLRMIRHSTNAGLLADFLSSHPKVVRVNYTGLADNPFHQTARKQMKYFGGMLSFDAGSKEKALRCLDKLKLCCLAPTMGDTDTLVLHPATSSHINVSKEIREANAITDGLIRVSVGIESPEDIIGDFNQALDFI